MRKPTLDQIKKFIVRPGIEKHLVPLLLYRGNMALGRVQQLWNHSILMMESEADSISDGLKVHANHEYAQLCGPHKPPTHLNMFSFFSRCKWNPKVTDNIPGLTEYVSYLMGDRGFHLEPIPLETPWRTNVPWRRSLSRARQPGFLKGKPKSAELFYPFLIHEPGKEHDLLLTVNKAVPKGMPDDLRADICQDLIVAILSGDITRDELQGHVRTYVRKVLNMFPVRYGLLSLDQPAPWAREDERTLGELISSEADHW